MRVRNHTDYSTRALRTLLCAVHATEKKKGQGPLRQWGDLTVQISYSRRGNRPYTGHAYLDGYHAHLSVPRGGVQVLDLIALWRHELWHLYGHRHSVYPESLLYCRVTEFERSVAHRPSVASLGECIGLAE